MLQSFFTVDDSRWHPSFLYHVGFFFEPCHGLCVVRLWSNGGVGLYYLRISRLRYWMWRVRKGWYGMSIFGADCLQTDWLLYHSYRFFHSVSINLSKERWSDAFLADSRTALPLVSPPLSVQTRLLLNMGGIGVSYWGKLVTSGIKRVVFPHTYICMYTHIR